MSYKFCTHIVNAFFKEQERLIEHLYTIVNISDDTETNRFICRKCVSDLCYYAEQNGDPYILVKGVWIDNDTLDFNVVGTKEYIISITHGQIL
jgi:hypothetical protein